MPLTDNAIRHIKPGLKTVKVSDGGGLFFQIEPNGSKFWRMAYRFGGKQKLLSLGKYPDISLARARERAREARALLSEGKDPSEVKRAEKAARANQAEFGELTFSSIAEEFVSKANREGKAAVTIGKLEWLISLAAADLGSRAIREITAPDVLRVLRRVEAKGNYETARRLRSTMSRIFCYAVATARADFDPVAATRGALTTPVVTHRAAMTTAEDFARLLQAIWDYTGAPTTRVGLMLLAYLYPRPGELRLAEWAEFDLDRGVWKIPAKRTKMRREHRKPLPPQAVSILRDLYLLTGDGRLVFPALHTRLKPMSENTFVQALRRLGFETHEASAHGFRATASTLLNESGKWRPDVIETELAHISTDTVRRAYLRADFWPERVGMANWWADECDRLRTSLEMKIDPDR